MRLDKVLEYNENNTSVKLERWQINDTDWFLRLYLFCEQAKELVCFDTKKVQRDENGRNEWYRMQRIANAHLGRQI